MDPRGQVDRQAVARAGEVDEEQRGAVADEEPRPVVVGRAERRQQRRDRFGGGGVAGERKGQFAP